MIKYKVTFNPYSCQYYGYWWWIFLMWCCLHACWPSLWISAMILLFKSMLSTITCVPHLPACYIVTLTDLFLLSIFVITVIHLILEMSWYILSTTLKLKPWVFTEITRFYLKPFTQNYPLKWIKLLIFFYPTGKKKRLAIIAFTVKGVTLLTTALLWWGEKENKMANKNTI